MIGGFEFINLEDLSLGEILRGLEGVMIWGLCDLFLYGWRVGNSLVFFKVCLSSCSFFVYKREVIIFIR